MQSVIVLKPLWVVLLSNAELKLVLAWKGYQMFVDVLKIMTKSWHCEVYLNRSCVHGRWDFFDLLGKVFRLETHYMISHIACLVSHKRFKLWNNRLWCMTEEWGKVSFLLFWMVWDFYKSCKLVSGFRQCEQSSYIQQVLACHGCCCLLFWN